MADIKVEGNNLNENHPVKKRKLDDAVKEKQADVHSNIEDLSSFKLEKILNNNTRSKIVCLQGTFSDADGAGLVILEKSAFEEENLKCNSEYFSTSSHLKKVFHNDIYGNYEYYPVSQLNSIKTTIIHPATEKHIEKYSIQNPYIVDETPDIYESAVLPFIIKEQFDLQWVYNILEHKCEADRIVFEDPDPVNGFLLLPDLKWNGTTLDTLYLLAIVNDRHIKSLRDLRGEHIPLLKNIFNKGCKTIEEKYGIAKSQLRIYLHYQPSFYHLHVHFTYLKHEAPGILAERAHLLSNVISNIELVADYYKKVTIPFVVRETDKLFKVLEEKDILKKSCLKV
ncbi:histidine triad hit protein member [Holotrichia oblita]|uniref:Histidine triad hit protein member n=1 Tax=Holotrichia oblita TaxID=644536 RepID=A0ACB9TS78_HOLOL|nr:histidine triad hit protein member [Holotrichia oblita]